MATTLWSEATINPSSPVVKSTCQITSQSRSGNTQKYTVKISMHCGDSLSWYNNRWACKVTIGGTVIAKNLTIKPVTSGTLGTKVYSAECSGSISISGNTGTASVSVEYWDTNSSSSLTGTKLKTKTASISYNPLSVVSLAINSYTNNSASLKYTYANIAPTSVKVYANNALITTVSSTPFTVTGLKPKTKYTFYANGYANGGYGSNGNTVSLTTYPNPVTVSGVTFSNLQPFQATATATSSSTTDTNSIEFALLDSSGAVVASSTGTAYSWTPVNLLPETQYRFRVRMKTNSSGVWSNYVYSAYFTTPADQASIYIKDNNTWTKGKLYYKENGEWIPAKKVYLKGTEDWIVGVNN